MVSRLKKQYDNEFVPRLQKELNLSNVMEVPKITKITLNMGVGESVGDKKIMDFAVKDLELIAGQKPIVTNAKKSIAGFFLFVHLDF